MSKVSISEAIRMTQISRSNFYKNYINQNKLSITIENNKKYIDVSELIRVFGNIQLENNNKEQVNTSENNSNTEDKNKMIQLLENQLAEAKEREKWLQQQLEKVTLLIEDKSTKKKKRFWIF